MKIICIGLNYHSHILELKSTTPDFPVFFMKPETAMLVKNRPFFLPDFSNDIHYEAELLIRINKLGKSIQKRYAHTYYDEIGLGIDFTARDLQQKVRSEGLPWEITKSFDGSAVIGTFLPKTQFADLHQIPFHLQLNDRIVQQGNSSDLIFDFDTIIEYVSQFVTLKIGDIIFTGTPVGVGPVKINDRLQGFIGEQKLFDFRVK
ncbi:MAG TPA: fumarylacetoacetate hydrolase family protein [Bacteroidales bacterium]|jgi:2-keto-4-pentenoate hydratase/2-oxohepta-3-ene-1,7-dioic acid hydratase in catechol pathway|nr:fumarylacetoacetate hydrolase family protein [Bacteroidales bacterium]HPE39935.1 fumarylacetoacetate hydrolase family protein [Bacteroidales bacterium]